MRANHQRPMAGERVILFFHDHADNQSKDDGESEEYQKHPPS
jgi:hypothetical protein